MSTDPVTPTAGHDAEPIPSPPTAVNEGREAIHRIFLEALAKEKDGAAAFRHVLAHVPLSADQKAIFELLASLGEKEPDSQEAPAATVGDGQVADSVDRELADLRQVNDTCAAALGACRLCWGGDPACPVCGGRGRAGFALPEVALFKELVVPAISRLQDLRRATEWMGGSRDGRVRPQWRR